MAEAPVTTSIDQDFGERFAGSLAMYERSRQVMAASPMIRPARLCVRLSIRRALQNQGKILVHTKTPRHEGVSSWSTRYSSR